MMIDALTPLYLVPLITNITLKEKLFTEIVQMLEKDLDW